MLLAMSHSALVVAAQAAARPGYDSSSAATERRVRPMLEDERVVWLSTVGEDGCPHLVPTWFWWDGEALVVYSKPEAVKVRNLRANRRLMVAVGHPDEDFAVGLIEAVAELVDTAVPDAFFGKYAADLAEASLDPHRYRAIYTQAVRVIPTRFLPWRGRSARHDLPEGGPAATVGGALPRVADWVAGCMDAAAARLRAAAAPRGSPFRAGGAA